MSNTKDLIKRLITCADLLLIEGDQEEVEAIAEAIAELERLWAEVEARQWQPIETAPKDGRDLLLWETGSYVPFVGAWRDGRRPGWRCDTEHYDTDGNACVISKLWQEGVTHWMPLPPPIDAARSAQEPAKNWDGCYFINRAANGGEG